MKKLVVIIIIAGAAYYYYDAKGSNEYTLQDSASNPIPKERFYDLWTEVAINSCKHAEDSYNTTEKRCKDDIYVKSNSCSRKFYSELPDFIDNKEASKQYGRKYLDCIMPYYYCNGVEVRSEQEAREHCG
ncbi:hypothetical protein [Hahella ganghwensis]|uniref:hypothetical protein n=1 Tax=Hahella ganghwensis TaxID=286420 RepID=UPI0012F9926F|nr:hypothetical protein [Hahella ganghwensis]